MAWREDTVCKLGGKICLKIIDTFRSKLGTLEEERNTSRAVSALNEKLLLQYRANQFFGKHEENEDLISKLAKSTDAPIDLLKQRIPIDERLKQPFSLSRLMNPEALHQVGFNAFAGGFGGTVGSLVGGLAGGAPGALAGGLAGREFEEVIKRVGEAFASAAEKGIEFEQSISSIAAVFQSNSRLVGASNLPEEIKAQQDRARALQQEIRPRLLRLGVGGEAENTIVRSIVENLGQRGVNLDAQQTGTLAQRLTAGISLIRPDLLQNTGRLSGDIADLISGSPQASRTALAQAIGKGGIAEFESALRTGNADKILEATKRLQSFVDAVEHSGLAAQQLTRIQGELDNAFTRLGTGLTDSLAPGLKQLADALSNPLLAEQLEALGRAAGNVGSGVAGGASSVANFAIPATSLANAPLSEHPEDAVATGLGGLVAAALGKDSGGGASVGKQIMDLLKRITAGPKDKVAEPVFERTPEAIAKEILGNAGLEEQALRSFDNIRDPLKQADVLRSGRLKLLGTSAYAQDGEAFGFLERQKRQEAFDKQSDLIGGIRGVGTERFFQGQLSNLLQQQKDFAQNAALLREQSAEAAKLGNGQKAADLAKQAAEASRLAVQYENDKLSLLSKIVGAREEELGVLRQEAELKKSAIVGQGARFDLQRAGIDRDRLANERSTLGDLLRSQEKQLEQVQKFGSNEQIAQIQRNMEQTRQRIIANENSGTELNTQQFKDLPLHGMQERVEAAKVGEGFRDALAELKDRTADLGTAFQNAQRSIEDFGRSARLANLSGRDRVLELGRQYQEQFGKLPSGVSGDIVGDLLFGDQGRTKQQLLEEQIKQASTDYERTKEDNEPFGRNETALYSARERIERQLKQTGRGTRDAQLSYLLQSNESLKHFSKQQIDADPELAKMRDDRDSFLRSSFAGYTPDGGVDRFLGGAMQNLSMPFGRDSSGLLADGFDKDQFAKQLNDEYGKLMKRSELESDGGKFKMDLNAYKSRLNLFNMMFGQEDPTLGGLSDQTTTPSDIKARYSGVGGASSMPNYTDAAKNGTNALPGGAQSNSQQLQSIITTLKAGFDQLNASINRGNSNRRSDMTGALNDCFASGI